MKTEMLDKSSFFTPLSFPLLLPDEGKKAS